MGNNISVKEAARIMGKSEQFIRIGLQRNILPIGTAIQLTNKNYTYYISPKQLDIINRMSKYPQLFANEEDEKNIMIEDYENILELLKVYYHKMFENENLEKRLQLYYLIYDIHILTKYELKEEELLYRIEEDLKE